MEKRGYDISFAGNSLGGALAQWFAAYVSDEGIRLKDVVTFNPAGISKKVDGEYFDRVKAESVRHYINSGDIISLSGDWMLPGEYTLFANTTDCINSDVWDYLVDEQHRYTLFFLDSLGSDRRDPNLTVLKTGDSSELSNGMFSYLAVKVDSVSGLRPANNHDIVTFSNGETYLFNTEFAEAIMLLADGSAGHANDYSRRSSLEHLRSDDLYEMIRDMTSYDDSQRYHVSVINTPVENAFNYYLRGIDLDGNGMRDMYFDFSASRFIRSDVNVSVTTKVSKYTCTVKWPKLSSASGGYEVKLNDDTTLTKKTSVTFKDLAIGDYVCRVREAFTGTWSDELHFSIKDVTPPVMKISVAVKGYDAVIALNGTDNIGIKKYIVSCGDRTIESAPVSELVIRDLAPGKYTVTAMAVDLSDLTSKKVKSKITVLDVTPPEKVSGLTAETSYRKDRKTLLRWDETSDNLGVTKYLVSVDGGKAKSVSARKLDFLTGGLSVGFHTFRVAASDKAKNISEWSEEKVFEVADVAAPAKPKLRALKSDDAVELAWNLPKDNVRTTAFELDVFKNGLAFGDTLRFGAETLSHTFENLSDGSYRFELSALDAAGNESLKSVIAS